MPIEILLLAVGFLPILAAWWAWSSKDRALLGGTRKSLFTAGLIGVSGAFLLYCAFVIYIYHIHGFGTNFGAMLKWARSGFWASVLAMFLALAGQGKSRILGCVSAFIIAVIWMIPVWGM